MPVQTASFFLGLGLLFSLGAATTAAAEDFAVTIRNAIASGQTAPLDLRSTWDVSTSFEVPATITLRLLDGASIVVRQGAVLTLQGPLLRGALARGRVFSEPGRQAGGTSADARVSRLKFGPKALGSFALTPQLWGAAGNGVTNDTDAIQLAIDAARSCALPGVSGCGKVFLPAGKYPLTRPIQSENVQVSGPAASPLSALVLPSSGVTAFQLRGQASLENIGIHYPRTSPAASGVAAIELGVWTGDTNSPRYSWNHNTLRNLEIRNAFSGIVSTKSSGGLSDSWGNTFENIQILDHVNWAVYLAWHSSVLKLNNILIQGDARSAIAKGIYIDGTLGTNISNTDISGLSDGQAIVIQYDQYTSFNTVITNLRLHDLSLDTRDSALVRIANGNTRIQGISAQNVAAPAGGLLVRFAPDRRVARIASLRLGGVTVSAPPANFFKLLFDGNNGGDVIVDPSVLVTDVRVQGANDWERLHFVQHRGLQ